MAGRSGQVRAHDVQLLGRVSVRDREGRLVDVGPAKSQVVLAALALSVGSPVTVSRLVDAVWGDRPPRTAERTLQAYLTRLRAGLGPASIARTVGAYRLDLPPESVDVARFEALLDAGDLGGALAEWRGPPLDGLEAPGLDSAVAGLTERWLGAVEQDLARTVDTDPASAIPRLTELTASYPLRESFWGLLMTALHRVGRQADALAAYRSAHARLAEALAVEPGQDLRALHLRILRQEEGPAPGRSVGRPEPAPPTGTVTCVVVDLDGASAGWADDPAAMAHAVAVHDQRVRELAARNRGHVFTRSGDSHGIAFRTADDAAHWAHALAADAVEVDGVALRARIGMHTGEAGEHDGGYFGPAVHTAARLAATAHAGQTLMTSATAELLDRAPLRALGPHALEGVVAVQQLYQLDDGEHPPLRTDDRRLGNLPRRIGRLVGRDEELQRIRAALADHPVVTLVGPGGIGKTHLALAAAREHATRDVWLVELAAIESGEDVPRAVAEALGVTDRQGRPLAGSIVDTLRTRRSLLVLDNCEQVVDAAADLAALVAAHCPRARVLATSRERLGLTGERVVSVPPLDPGGSAVALFGERAAEIDAAFDRTVEQPAVEEICRRLDGIPLAIELAAARTATLSPDELLHRLRHLDVLDGTRRAGPDRHRTLWSAIRWSHDLLSPLERTVFGRLSVFAGGFDVAAAEWVAGVSTDDSPDVANALARLAEQSLVTVAAGPFGRTFRLLAPIRAFAREQLEQSGDTEVVAQRHVQWCACELAGIHALLAGWGEPEGVARLSALWPNLRVAFEWACSSGRVDLARDLLTPVVSEIVVRSANELGDWAERLLAVTAAEDTRTRTVALYAAAHRYSMTQDPAAYLSLLERYGEPEGLLMRHARAVATEDHALMAEVAGAVAARFRSIGDDLMAERAEINAAAASMNLGRLEEAEQRLAELVGRYREQGPPTFLNWTLFLLGYSALFRGDGAGAEAYFAEGVAIELPPRTHTPSEPLRARAAFARGDHERAFRILRDHVDELLATDNMQAGMMDCIEFLTMMTSTGRVDEAALVLGHLESGSLLDGPGWRMLVADSARCVAEHARPGSGESIADDREALEYVRAVLTRLLEPEDPE